MNAHEWVEASSSNPYSTLWMSRVTCPVVISLMRESCHIWMSNIKAHTTLAVCCRCTRCNILQHAPTHYHTLQSAATGCSILQHTAIHVSHAPKYIPTLYLLPLKTGIMDDVGKKKSINDTQEKKRHITDKVQRAVCCMQIPHGKEYSTSLPVDWLQHILPKTCLMAMGILPLGLLTGYNTLRHTTPRCNTL